MSAAAASFDLSWWMESEELTLMGREEREQPAGFSGLKAGSSAGAAGRRQECGLHGGGRPSL